MDRVSLDNIIQRVEAIVNLDFQQLLETFLGYFTVFLYLSNVTRFVF